LNDILLKDIQYSFITDLEHFFKGQHANAIITVLRSTFDPIKNDWLDKDPFKAYRVKLKDTKRVFLTKEELAALEKYSYRLID